MKIPLKTQIIMYLIFSAILMFFIMYSGKALRLSPD
jgi:hypothetical protein